VAWLRELLPLGAAAESSMKNPGEILEGTAFRSFATYSYPKIYHLTIKGTSS
jgi:hypothetical protein